MSEVLVSNDALTKGTSVGEEDMLILRCISGEEAAFVSVYRLYARLIYRLCFGLLQHREDAEEVLQDTFEYAFRRINTYDSNKAGFKTWLYQIAVSRCRNKRRRKWLRTLPLTNDLGESLIDISAPSPSDIADLSYQQQEIWRAIGELSTKLRESIYLRYYEGLTYAEIGAVLNIPSKTAESRVRLGHKALRILLMNKSDETSRE